MEMIAVVGLGYVGLPLAVAFGKLMPTLGHDLSQAKVVNYQQHTDLGPPQPAHERSFFL